MQAERIAVLVCALGSNITDDRRGVKATRCFTETFFMLNATFGASSVLNESAQLCVYRTSRAQTEKELLHEKSVSYVARRKRMDPYMKSRLL